LEYFVGVDLSPHDPPPLSVFVARRDTAALIPLSATEPELNILVDVYRRALLLGKTRPDDDVWRGPAHTLYTALLAPVVDNGMLQAGDHVIIAPHRILHVLPFHALTTTAPADSPRFFMEHHLVSYTPSAAYLVEVRKQPPRPLRTMLAAAPDGRTLPYAETEIKRIPDGLFARTKRLRETDATADEVLYAPRAYDVVHLAAHARMNLRHPLYSYLQCADRRLALHEILRQRFRARLVVLSACETGRGVGALGAVPSGEDMVSFPRAFMEAGVTSVVASLWLVEDEATATLMEQFYKAWKDSPEATSLVQALNRAQRRVLAEARHANHEAHPFYWAGFYLTGDSR
jgi:CHAT domain-containing protein